MLLKPALVLPEHPGLQRSLLVFLHVAHPSISKVSQADRRAQTRTRTVPASQCISATEVDDDRILGAMAFPPAGATGAAFRARDRRRGIIWGAMAVLTIVILLVSATDSWPSLQGRGHCCREAGAVVVRLAALAPCPP